MTSRRIVAACVVLLVILLSSIRGYSADVVLIRSGDGLSSSQENDLELATRFYGVNLKVVTAGHNNTLDAVRQKGTLAVAIEANALASVNRTALLRARRRGTQSTVPLLVLGVAPETGSDLLRDWSGGTAVGTERLVSPLRLHYVVGRAAGITQQLADLDAPFPGNEAFYLGLVKSRDVRELVSVASDHQTVPVFIQVDLDQEKVFLLCNTHPAGDSAIDWRAESGATQFLEIAPLMMFVRYSAGELGWHTVHHYANLTIDDPWLREPYGHLSYGGLLKEMEKHDFHTTIAFIPWNYDRSEPATVSLLQNHPERFSICIHGDNHDQKEFEDLKSRPLHVQIAALKQSLARMQQFHNLTGLPYDNVFVFPHSIGSGTILEELKSYNFAATVNSANVPMDRPRPSDPLFGLRPITSAFADFPSIARYSVAVPLPKGLIQINEFLGNPLFFYGHQDLFASGMDAFNDIADEVNKSETDTEWRSAGDIVEHLYLVKLREDGNYDVLSFANRLRLENTSGRGVVFNVRKAESDSANIASVNVEGRDQPFLVRDGYLELSLSVPPGEGRSVSIRYKNDLDLASVSTAKTSLRVYLLRKASDFRDITLSEYAVGRTLTEFYYRHKLTPALATVGGGAVILFCISGVLGLLAIAKRRSPVALRRENSSERAEPESEANQMTRYVIITPVRDEGKFIEETIASVKAQTIPPAEWVIVDDGSTDRTGELIDRHAAEVSWIRAVHRANRGFRQAGGGVMEAFYDGYHALRCDDWDFIVKLDGDLTLPATYFEACFDHFERDPKLGVGGGDIYHNRGAMQALERNPRFHVRGATKIYRRACWEAIGGLWRAPGWDTIDEVKANMLGWTSYSFSELQIAHHRVTGTAEGLLRDRMKHGVACYVSGYHPLFLLASCLRRLIQKPYVAGSAAMFYGFLRSYCVRMPRVTDTQLIKYLRTQQLRRLCGLETIWR